MYLIDLDVDWDTNIQNIACLGKIMSISNKQHLRNIQGSIYQEVKNIEAQFNECVAYIKKHGSNR